MWVFKQVMLGFLGLLLASTSFLYGAQRTKLVIDITNPNFRRFSIAIPDFQNTGDKLVTKPAQEFGEQISHTIGKLLVTTGLFDLFAKKSFIGNENEPDKLENWKSLKVDGLIQGTFKLDNGKLTTEIKLFNVERSKLIVWKKYYNGEFNDFREIAKRFSNEIIYVLTGSEGIFKSKIVFLKKMGHYKNVYLMDMDGEKVSAVTQHKSIHLSPSWSPDGKKITYTSYKRGNPDLYVYSLITKKEIRISSRKGLNTGGSWSNDGKKVLFTRSFSGDADIYTISPDGTDIKALVTGYGLDITPKLSPSGDILAFVSGRSGSPHIWVMDMVSRKLGKLTNKGRYNADPSWSPDGKKIAFAGFDNGHFDIFIMNPDPVHSNFERLTINTLDNEHPSWSPDGKQIVFQSNRDGQHELYLMNADGSNQRRLTYGMGECSSPEWSKSNITYQF